MARLFTLRGPIAGGCSTPPAGAGSVRRLQVQVRSLRRAVLVRLVAHHADKVELAVVHTALSAHGVGKRGDQRRAALRCAAV